MKNISLPQKELRLLSAQLQNFQQGYTVQQIRSLDRIIKITDEVLKPFVEGLNKILINDQSHNNEKEKQEFEIKKQSLIEAYFNLEGNKEVNCSFIDEDFDFVKSVWLRMGTLNGTKEAREAILKIDDAIQGAKEPVFEKGVN